MLGAADPSLLVAMGAASFVIGLAKGGLSGFGPLLTLLVALAVPTSVAIGVLLPFLMVGDVFALWAHWGQWNRSILVRLLPSAAVGVGVASLFLQSVSDDGLRVFLAVVTIGFVAYRLAETRIRAALGRGSDRPGGVGPRWAAAAGSAAGVTSTVAHVGGPPISIYLLSARVEPRPYVATSAAFFFVVNWLKVPGYLAADLLDLDLLLDVAPTAALIGPGILAGKWFVTNVPPRVFDAFVLLSLVAGAVLLLV